MKSKTVEPKLKQRLQSQTKPSASIPPYYFAAALAIVVVICYANSLNNQFVFDDHTLVFQGKVSGVEEFFNRLFSSYRPLRTVSYALDFAIWGDSPFGFRLTNVFIHAANAVLVFFLTRTITSRNKVAYVASLIFALHPIQTDAVTYISGRRDVLFTLFYLAAFFAYLKYKSTKKILYLIGSAICWGLSLMSKEMAASLPLVIFAWNFCDLYETEGGSTTSRLARTIKGTLLRDKWLYLLLVAAAAGYAWYMVAVRYSSGRITGGEVHFWGGSLFATILTSIRIHAWYLKQLIFPTPIAQYLGAFEPSTTLQDWRFIVSAIVVGAVLVSGFLALKKNRLVAFSIFSFFAMLAPVSQIIPHHELLADHYLYLPMLSFGLLTGLVVDQVVTANSSAKPVAYAVLALLLLFFAISTVRRNNDWEDELTLWQATYNAVPDSPRAAYNLGVVLQRTNPQRAEQLLKQTLAKEPDFELAYLTLARLYLNQKRTVEAEEVARRGIELLESGGGSFIVRNKPLLMSQFTVVLAGVEWEKGNPQKAEGLMRGAIQIYPANDEAYLALATVYRGKDRSREVEIMQEAVTTKPGSYVRLARLASALFDAARIDETIATLNQMAGARASGSDCARAAPFLQTIKTGIAKNLEGGSVSQALQRAEEPCRSQ